MWFGIWNRERLLYLISRTCMCSRWRSCYSLAFLDRFSTTALPLALKTKADFSHIHRRPSRPTLHPFTTFIRHPHTPHMSQSMRLLLRNVVPRRWTMSGRRSARPCTRTSVLSRPSKSLWPVIFNKLLFLFFEFFCPKVLCISNLFLVTFFRASSCQVGYISTFDILFVVIYLMFLIVSSWKIEKMHESITFT